jgi:hypothetical protein
MLQAIENCVFEKDYQVHENWAFDTADLESVWVLFGSRIGEAIESSSE